MIIYCGQQNNQNDAKLNIVIISSSSIWEAWRQIAFREHMDFVFSLMTVFGGIWADHVFFNDVWNAYPLSNTTLIPLTYTLRSFTSELSYSNTNLFYPNKKENLKNNRDFHLSRKMMENIPDWTAILFSSNYNFNILNVKLWAVIFFCFCFSLAVFWKKSENGLPFLSNSSTVSFHFF